MDFRFDDEQVALRDAIRALCQQHFALVRRRRLAEATAADAATWRALADMGVFGMLLPSSRAGRRRRGRSRHRLRAARRARRDRPVAVVDDRRAAAARRRHRRDPRHRHRADDCGRRSSSSTPRESDVVLVVADDGVESFATLRAPERDGRRAARSADARARLSPTCRRGTAVGGPEDAQRLRLVGTILAAAQLVGVAQGALDVASAYALERHQFGVPIGSFQAIKHLLADMYVRVELARSATYAAAAVFDDERAGDVTTAASTAKLLAGEAGIANGKTAVQVLGGMGFTWEMTPHYFLKRAWVLEEAFGTGDTHALTLSDALESEVPSAR